MDKDLESILQDDVGSDSDSGGSEFDRWSTGDSVEALLKLNEEEAGVDERSVNL